MDQNRLDEAASDVVGALQQMKANTAGLRQRLEEIDQQLSAPPQQPPAQQSSGQWVGPFDGQFVFVQDTKRPMTPRERRTAWSLGLSGGALMLPIGAGVTGGFLFAVGAIGCVLVLLCLAYVLGWFTFHSQ